MLTAGVEMEKKGSLQEAAADSPKGVHPQHHWGAPRSNYCKVSSHREQGCGVWGVGCGGCQMEEDLEPLKFGHKHESDHICIHSDQTTFGLQVHIF